MSEELISQGFRLGEIDKTRNYFLEEIRTIKKFCMILNYIEHLLILLSITTYVSVSAFVWLVGICISAASSAKELKIFSVTE